MPTACPRCSAPLPSDPAAGCPGCGWRPAPESPTVTHVPEPVAASETLTAPYAESPPSDENILAALTRRLPDYRDWAFVGRGGMGMVWSAFQPVLGRKVAVKVILPDLAERDGFAARFEREAAALAKLDRRDVVRVYDFGRADGIYFLVMEFVPSNLQEYREKLPGWRGPPRAREVFAPVGGTIDPGLARVMGWDGPERLRTDDELNKLLDFFLKVCAAVWAVHSAEFVHRDIKPTNILVTDDGQPKLADFGLVYGLERRADATATGAVGTPAYMAPEQAADPGNVTRAADVYALGVILYELLFGERPVGRFPMPSEIGLDPRLDAILARALDPDPKKRYATAAGLHAVIAEVRNVGRRKVRANNVLDVVFFVALVVTLLWIYPFRPSYMFFVMALGALVGWSGAGTSEARSLWYSERMRWVYWSVAFVAVGVVFLLPPALGRTNDNLTDGPSGGEWLGLALAWAYLQFAAVAVANRAAKWRAARVLRVIGYFGPLAVAGACAAVSFTPWASLAQWGPGLMAVSIAAAMAARDSFNPTIHSAGVGR